MSPNARMQARSKEIGSSDDRFIEFCGHNSCMVEFRLDEHRACEAVVIVVPDEIQTVKNPRNQGLRR